MKKIMIMALMVLGTTCAFAGDSDALKAIKKAKDFNEAQSLVLNSLAQLADDAEKAAAYNKLVDLAMDKYNKESTVVTENQLAAQMGGKEKPVDNDGMNQAAVNALKNAIECDKYDQLPNAKGKVAPRFSKNNALRTWPVVLQLVNAGQEAAQAKNQELALEYWGTIVDADAAPLFKDADRTNTQSVMGQVALFAAYYASLVPDNARTLRYCDVALKDAESHDEALRLKLDVLQAGLTSKADSLKFADNLKEMYAADPESDILLEKLYSIYTEVGEKASANKVLDEALARNPKNFVALADKGISAMNENDAENAVKYLRQAVDVKPDNAVVCTYLGNCLKYQAANTADTNQANKLLDEAISYYDKAKQNDPDQLQVRWGYNRYAAYAQRYGEDDPKTQAAQADQ